MEMQLRPPAGKSHLLTTITNTKDLWPYLFLLFTLNFLSMLSYLIVIDMISFHRSRRKCQYKLWASQWLVLFFFFFFLVKCLSVTAYNDKFASGNIFKIKWKKLYIWCDFFKKFHKKNDKKILTRIWHELSMSKGEGTKSSLYK